MPSVKKISTYRKNFANNRFFRDELPYLEVFESKHKIFKFLNQPILICLLYHDTLLQFATD